MKIAIIHSHNIESNGNPNSEYSQRLEKGLQLYFEQKVSQILLTGGKATSGVDLRHCDIGKKWLNSKGIPENDMKTENDPVGSLDSVGEVLFLRKNYQKILLSSSEISIISSNYHIGRLWEISSLLLGQEILKKIQMIGIPIIGGRSIEQELKSTEAFRNTFAGIPIGDLEAIEKQLWTNHNLYKNHPSNPLK